MEIKQHTTKIVNGSKRKLENILWQVKIKSQHTKTCKI